MVVLLVVANSNADVAVTYAAVPIPFDVAAALAALATPAETPIISISTPANVKPTPNAEAMSEIYEVVT